MKKPKLKLILIMLGHGDRYNTPGKRAYFKEGKLLSDNLSVTEREDICDEAIYEGELNRLVGAEFIKLLKENGYRFKLINEGVKDMSRIQRCNIANSYAKKMGIDKCLVISLHSDGFKKESAHGASCYTSPGQTLSDIYATEWYNQAKLMWPNEKLRKGTSDGDPDKEAKFTVLVKTICPAILVENFFFTNYNNYTTHLKCKNGRRKIAQVLLNMVTTFYQK